MENISNRVSYVQPLLHTCSRPQVLESGVRKNDHSGMGPGDVSRMAHNDISSRLAGGKRLLLDGGTASELVRRGVTFPKGKAWSGTAVRDAPQVVRQVHEDYLREGVDIVTANSFCTSRIKLATVNIEDAAEELTRRAVELAINARDAVRPDSIVAGSMSPMEASDIGKDIAEQAVWLAEAGADLLLYEWVGSIEDCVQGVQASQVGLPIFLGIRLLRMDGRMQYGNTVKELARELRELKVDAVLAMCSQAEAISTALPNLRASFDLPLGAYAHNLDHIAPLTPERYTEFAHSWLEMGAQIVGGCCGTGPEHIRAIGSAVKGANPETTPAE